MSDNVTAALGILSSRLKIVIPPTRNIAQELALLLNVSIEGAYRRLRGETNFNLKELLMVKEQWGISLDDLASFNQLSSISFVPLQQHNCKISTYIQDQLDRFSNLMRSDNSLTIMVCNHLPWFRMLNYPNLSQFKLHQLNVYITQKTTDPCPQEDQHWMADSLPVMEELRLLYQSVSSIEIWSSTVVESTLADIQHYLETGCLDPHHASSLLLEISSLLRDTFKDAEFEKKMHRSASKSNYFGLYIHRKGFANDSIMIETDDFSHLAYSFNAHNFIHTTDEHVVKEHRQWVTHLLDSTVHFNPITDEESRNYARSQLAAVRQFADMHLPPQIVARIKPHLYWKSLS